MRALANDREITATLGVPVRRVEAAAWFGSGLACGAAGLLLPDLLTSLDYSALTFLVISSLAAALIGRLRSLWVTLFGGLAVGLAQSVLARTPADLRVPLGGAVRARDRRAPLPVAPPRRHDLADGGREPRCPAERPSTRGTVSCERRSTVGAARDRALRCSPHICAAPTGSRRSRAWRSTRSPRSASASSTAASG